MNEINALAHELRLMARLVRDYDYKEISRMLREAADTIESLRKQVAKCQIAELKADYDTSRYFELFGTPERTARTLRKNGKCIPACYECLVRDECANLPEGSECPMDDYDVLLEWLRGDA